MEHTRPCQARVGRKVISKKGDVKGTIYDYDNLRAWVKCDDTEAPIMLPIVELLFDTEEHHHGGPVGKSGFVIS